MRNLFVILFLLTFGCTYAQNEIRFGAKAGLNLASISNNVDHNEQSRIGFEIGGLLEIPFSEKWSFAPEVLYSEKGEVTKLESPEDKYKSIAQLNYINVPLLAKFYLIKGFAVEAGPQVGFLVEASQSLSANGDFSGDFESLSDMNFEDNFSKLEVSGALGMSYRIPSGVFLQARYMLSFSNINASEDYNDKLHNSVFQISGGYSF